MEPTWQRCLGRVPRHVSPSVRDRGLRAGTIIEWYDFYLYGVLAAFFATQFFPPGNDTAALLSSLATFGAGFAVRPFGAAFFGRIGDITGRKFTFLLTILIMGGDGLRRHSSDVRRDRRAGTDHPRGAAPRPGPRPRRRVRRGCHLRRRARADHGAGKYTSFIQTTATLGLLLALAVIAFFRVKMAAAAFARYGWRIPFILSAVLVVIALFIRLRLQETPLFKA